MEYKTQEAASLELKISQRTVERAAEMSRGQVGAADVTELPRILVIDDEPLLGQTLQLGLEEQFEVELELTGQEGWARLESEEEFSLVLCDLSLPDLGGMEIYQRLLERRPEWESRFAVMTGGAMTQEAQDFLDEYRGLILQKPFTLREVELLVNQVLETGERSPASS